MAEPLKPTEKEISEFHDCETHEERCVYFHAHPALATIFRAINFEKPIVPVAKPAPAVLPYNITTQK